MLLVPAATAAEPETIYSQVVFKVDQEVDFEVVRKADGNEVELHIGRARDGITPPVVSGEDPLVGRVAVEDAASGVGAVATVRLRERGVRSSVQTLERPFRIVLDLVYEVRRVMAPARSGHMVDAVPLLPLPPSVFDIQVPLSPGTGPVLAVPVVESAIEGPPGEVFSAGVQALSGGHMAKALAAFQRLTIDYPDSPLVVPAAFYLAEIGYRQAWGTDAAGRVAAVKVFDKVSQENPRSPNVALALARMAEVLLAEGKLEEAKELTAVVMADYGGSPFMRLANLVRADVALKQNHQRTALKFYRKVLEGGEADSAGIAALYGMGETLVRMGRYPLAVTRYEKVVGLRPGEAKSRPQDLRRMARALMESGRFRDARHIFLILYNVYPAEFPPGLALSRVAETFQGEGRWVDAEKGYQEVISSYPRGEGSLAARLALADLYLERERQYRREKGEVPEVVAFDPFSGLLGNAASMGGDDVLLAEALRLYGEVVQQAPSDALAEEAIYKLAVLFEQMGDYEESLTRSLELLTRYPKTDWKRPVMELAELALAEEVTRRVQMGKAASAVSLYRSYLNPLFDGEIKGWKPHYPLGLASESIGLDQSAMRHYLALLGSRSPERYRVRAVFRLGNLYLKRGEPEEALKRYLYFTQRSNDLTRYDELDLRLAEAYAGNGEYRKSIASYLTYLKRLSPDDPHRRQILLDLADVYQKHRSPESATRIYLQVAKEDATSTVANSEMVPTTGQILLRLADMEYRLGWYDKAQKHYRNAVKQELKGDDLRWAELRIGTAALAGGRTREAEEVLGTLAKGSEVSVIPSVAREIIASSQLR
ncbi:MAG: tetratricopeptide repeat protein [Leptospirillia bacterium]